MITPHRIPVHRPQKGGAKDHRIRTHGEEFYMSTRWRKLRVIQLATFPLCADPWGFHAIDGMVVVATDIDHIIPRRDAPTRALDCANLQSLCASCHSMKSRRESQGWRQGPALEPTEGGAS